MELCLYKGLSVILLLLHLCQAQAPSDAALPSPSPESPPHSLDDVMDAVKAAFMEAAMISENDAVRAVFEQVVEELGPQENIAEEPPATADDTEDGLAAVVHEHADKETTNLSVENAKQEQVDPKLNSSEQTFRLPEEQEDRQGIGMGEEPDEKPVELISRLNKSPEVSVQEVEDTVTVAGDSMESTRESEEIFDSTDHIDRKYAERDESQGRPIDSDVQVEQEEAERVKDREMGKDEGWKQDLEVNVEPRIQNGEQLDQTQPEDQEHEDDLTVRIESEEKQSEGELVDVGEVVEAKTEEENVDGDEAAHIGEEVLSPGSKAAEETSQELDIMHETNEIVTSRDSVHDWEVPTLGIAGNALTPFPTLGVDLGESDELVEEPVDKTQSATPKQEAWKIGVIAVAFFLVLQTIVTVTYIMKCKRRRRSCAVPERACEDGIGAAEQDAANEDTDEPTTVDDLPERHQIQQETLAMTPVGARSGTEKSFSY